jgi:DNA-directed RNA polymerase subunit RPC12/RpoP
VTTIDGKKWKCSHCGSNKGIGEIQKGCEVFYKVYSVVDGDVTKCSPPRVDEVEEWVYFCLACGKEAEVEGA